MLSLCISCVIDVFLVLSAAAADDDDTATVEEDIGKSRDASRTDDEAVERYRSCSRYQRSADARSWCCILQFANVILNPNMMTFMHVSAYIGCGLA